MRFSIRDLLWLTVAVAVGLVFWLGSRKTAKLLDESIAREAKLHKLTNAVSERSAANWNTLHVEYTKVRGQLEKLEEQVALPPTLPQERSEVRDNSK